jgi:hypothetical protein
LAKSPCIWCWTNKERLWWTPQSNPQDVAAQRQAAARAHLGHLGLSGGGCSWWLSRWDDVWPWGDTPIGNFGILEIGIKIWGFGAPDFQSQGGKQCNSNCRYRDFQWFKQHDLGGKPPKRGLKQPKWGLNLQKMGGERHTHTKRS